MNSKRIAHLTFLVFVTFVILTATASAAIARTTVTVIPGDRTWDYYVSRGYQASGYDWKKFQMTILKDGHPLDDPNHLEPTWVLVLPELTALDHPKEITEPQLHSMEALPSLLPLPLVFSLPQPAKVATTGISLPMEDLRPSEPAKTPPLPSSERKQADATAWRVAFWVVTAITAFLGFKTKRLQRELSYHQSYPSKSVLVVRLNAARAEIERLQGQQLPIIPENETSFASMITSSPPTH